MCVLKLLCFCSEAVKHFVVPSEASWDVLQSSWNVSETIWNFSKPTGTIPKHILSILEIVLHIMMPIWSCPKHINSKTCLKPYGTFRNFLKATPNMIESWNLQGFCGRADVGLLTRQASAIWCGWIVHAFLWNVWNQIWKIMWRLCSVMSFPNRFWISSETIQILFLRIIRHVSETFQESSETFLNCMKIPNLSETFQQPPQSWSTIVWNPFKTCLRLSKSQTYQKHVTIIFRALRGHQYVRNVAEATEHFDACAFGSNTRHTVSDQVHTTFRTVSE